jgi:hypothetical protein
MTLILNPQIYNTWLQRELGEAMRVATAACGIPNPNPYPNPNPDPHLFFEFSGNQLFIVDFFY